MSIQNDKVKERFSEMLDTLSDIELARPFFVIEKQNGRSISEICVRYNKTRAVVKHQIKISNQKVG